MPPPADSNGTSTRPATTDADDPDDPTDVRLRVRRSPFLWLIVVVIVGIASGHAARRLDQVLELILAAAVLAILTLPVMRGLAAVGRGFSVASTAVLSLTASVVLGLVALRDLRTRSGRSPT